MGVADDGIKVSTKWGIGVYNIFLCIIAKIMRKIRNDPDPRGLKAENKLGNNAIKGARNEYLVWTTDTQHYDR